MKLGAYKPLHRGDVPLESPPQGEDPIATIPEWLDRMLAPIHSQLQALTRMGQGQVSFGENINGEVRVLSMRHNVPVDVSLGSLRGKPLGILPVFWDIEQFATFRPAILDLKTIRLTANFDSDPGRPVDVTVIVLGS